MNADITITNAIPSMASTIASLIMEAMNHDCCRWFAGERHTLGDFHQLLTALVRRDDSQYSHLNTFVALLDGEVVGALVCYDGGRLHELRRAFIDAARETLGMDHSGMDDETGPGELYLDSLCVRAEYRGQGIATKLIGAAVERARRSGLPAVGLLVDCGNPDAERLYRHLGFLPRNDSTWGGHPMRHLVLDLYK